ncbi:RNA 2',3'-cyclic phosphodiesterase [Aliiroseovarius sp. xm-m-379]|uniref:RNA 2',3'-cyclic phosphodiesterase n=1 Tax=unclassified Aliiroseovarius TaxID=2623558 RepID=UPI00156999DC|nr:MULTISPECIES: RNA 2',3'-cyclic phosphodiesterase [unclassified Aliiroseovarius]NRP12391.1 RNA 2',3'-cyclic phosphodiesterase [Aliiroseovarius sp. xm-d-517]NRP24765.1 RNA 2',3'-cyclic phosphodiesterase [Aliiroseovarius sp. xm-m-379]NRP30600.1 RNA 2',3'-cyclic phosphodiesterase [Aliiroseovarius sp. xm-m-314]NRP33564.1 RNA 2',3'-cyclic phosphodiesterase [Aliiroseovarius sp. xm-a-104]NRP40671.1 RNA 2',3'-cyclic phosphodiesterase [Aliiroseovarius sp. xm-m-339-2]
MRSFIACPLPETVRAVLVELAGRVKAGRAVPEDNLHLTLAFLDEQPVERLEALHGELEAILSPPIHLVLHGLEPMGGKTPSVLAIRADGAEALRAQVMSATRAAGITLPHRRYRGHITIARLPRRPLPEDQVALGRALEAFGDLELPPLTLDRFALFRSDLHPDGARHEMLAEYKLAV